MSVLNFLGNLGAIGGGYVGTGNALQQLRLRQLQEQQAMAAMQGQEIAGQALGAIPGGLPMMSQAPQMAAPQPQQQPMPMMPQTQGMAGSPGAVRGSWFGNFGDWRDPSDSGKQASGVPVEAGQPGIALPSRSTLGQQFDVTAPSGQTYRLPQTDIGPAAWTGRGVDINAPAAQKMGYTPQNFPTDATFLVQRVTGPAAMQQAQGSAPMPLVKSANNIANQAGTELDPQQFGTIGLRDVVSAVDKAAPNASGIEKFHAVAQLMKLVNPQDQMMFRLIAQQNAQAYRSGMAEYNQLQQNQRLDQRLAQQRELFDERMRQLESGAGRTGGSPYQPTDAEGKPIGAPGQIVGGQFQPIKGLPEGAGGMSRIGTARAGGVGGVSDSEAEFAARWFMSTGQMPGGTRNKEMINAALKKVAELGGDPNAIAAAGAGFKANQSSLAAATKMADAAIGFEETALKNLEVATKSLHGVAPTELGPALNKWIETGQTFVGDPSVPASVAAVITFANEYAKVMSGATGAQAATEGSRHEAAALFNPYFSAGQWDRVAAIARADMANRKAALKENIANITARIKSGGASEKSETSPPSAPASYATPSDVAGAVKAGKITPDQGMKILETEFGVKPQ